MEGEEKRETIQKKREKREGVRMLERTPAPLIMIKRFSPKDGGVAVLLRS